MKTEIRIIGPKVAQELLKKNPNNRRLTDNHVKFLAKQMEEGSWKFDGQPVRLDKYGRLLDGQHRLNAIIESETSQKFLVISGLEEESFHVMDTGKARTAGDVLSIEGVSSSSHVAAAAKFAINFKNGHYSGRGSEKLSNVEVVKWCKNNPDIADEINTAQHLKREFNGVLPTSQICGLKYILKEKSVTDAEIFLNKLCTGLGLETNSPIAVLRKKLIQDKLSKSNLPFREKLALIMKAWNKFRRNETTKFLRWNKDNEEFPAIV